jgi:hypothetical protein
MYTVQLYYSTMIDNLGKIRIGLIRFQEYIEGHNDGGAEFDRLLMAITRIADGQARETLRKKG